MKNQRINEQVAKKLGWIQTSPDKWWQNPNATALHESALDYCTDIRAAWEIVEKCEYFCLIKPLNNEKWKCDIGTKNEIVVIWADTAPMAICLAFLKI